MIFDSSDLAKASRILLYLIKGPKDVHSGEFPRHCVRCLDSNVSTDGVATVKFHDAAVNPRLSDGVRENFGAVDVVAMYL